MKMSPSTHKKLSPDFLRLFRIPVFTLAIMAFLFTGCKKDLQQAAPLAPVESAALTSGLPAQIPAALTPTLGKFEVIAPFATNENARQGEAKKISTELLKFDPQYRAMVLRALKLSAATCDDNTHLNQWLDQQLGNWTPQIINYVLNTAMLDLPTYHALLFENRTLGQYFGQRGEYTFALLKTFLTLKRFWDIDSRHMVLAAMHGSMLSSRNKLYKTYQYVYGLEPEDATYYTDLVSQLLQVFPQLKKGNHPIFTFNAFSQSSFFFEPVGTIPAKIVMGDGILEGFTAIGYGDVAPQAILAHEYGHQVQFQLGIFGVEDSPEATRRTELMADAFSAYYLTHVRGEVMHWKRARQFLQVFFNIGDCATTSLGHHGTPNQRMAAAEWGYEIAKNAQKQGLILPSKVFAKMFEAALPKILAH